MNKKSMIGVLPIILILAFLFTGMVYASQWARIFGGVDGDINSIKQTLDGGYIVAGRVERDARILKLDANGYFQWEKRTSAGVNNDMAFAYSVQQTSDGGYIVAGHKDEREWVLKLDINGNVVWQKTYGNIGAHSAASIQQTSDGGYVALSGGLVFKLYDNGDIQWSKSYGNSLNSIQQTSDGGYIMAGDTRSFGAGESDACVLKLDKNGNVLWQKTYGGIAYDRVNSIQTCSLNINNKKMFWQYRQVGLSGFIAKKIITND